MPGDDELSVSLGDVDLTTSSVALSDAGCVRKTVKNYYIYNIHKERPTERAKSAIVFNRFGKALFSGLVSS